MHGVWLRLMSIASVSCLAMNGPGSSSVTWKDVGESITIQCRLLEPDPVFLDLQRGLGMESIFFLAKPPSEPQHRLQSTSLQSDVHNFPSVDVLITNLTYKDMGPYWCVYKKMKNGVLKELKGNGSVILVVRDTVQRCGAPENEPVSNTLVMVSFVISATLLLGIIAAIFIFIIKGKVQGTAVKPRRAANNDVYEDMRGTIRR
ncbi:uncharacterized protein LOC117528487 [Thalassophryne amazonica]|uniref:uncharacterized protein LOC117528487 n=1 Tax=Thalassophryne amazonica TaxID=390379 RepID=UPI001471A674|nr:uncharacterized protein LOC117528487 [Thalassophryne amazonica]